MSRKAGLDSNHHAIVAVLEAMGCSVTSLAAVGGGVVDLLVGCSGVNLLMELKDGDKSPSRRRLRKSQVDWHASWRGQRCVILSVADAINVVNATRRGS